jgi:hypothetical protein
MCHVLHRRAGPTTAPLASAATIVADPDRHQQVL